jgi:hypothetical protein
MRLSSLLTAVCICFFIFSGVAQRFGSKHKSKIVVTWHKEGWTIDGAVGVRTLGKRSADVERVPGLALQGGVGYIFNKVVGVRGRLDYYNHQLSTNFRPMNANGGYAHSVAASLVSTVDLVPLITKRKGRIWHFNVYAGPGLTTAWNKEPQIYMTEHLGSSFNDPGLEGNDDMGHILFGINPQFHFNSSFALTFDVSSFLLLNQDFTYDWNTQITDQGLGSILNFSFGFLWYPRF